MVAARDADVCQVYRGSQQLVKPTFLGRLHDLFIAFTGVSVQDLTAQLLVPCEDAQALVDSKLVAVV